MLSRKLLSLLTLITLLVLTKNAFCVELQPDALFNNLSNEFIGAVKDITRPVKAAADRLFWLLVPISVVTLGYKMIFADGNMQTLMLHFTGLVLSIGFYLFFLDHAIEIGVSILESMLQLVGGKTYGPSELIDLVFNLNSNFNKCISDNLFSPMTAFFMRALVAIFCVILFLPVMNFTILYLGAYILCYIGVFVLGFSSFKPTRQFALNYLYKIISMALELMTTIVIVDASCSVLERINEKAEDMAAAGNALTSNICMILIFVAIFIYVLVQNIPPVVGSLVAPSDNRGNGGMLFSSIRSIKNSLSKVTTSKIKMPTNMPQN